MIHKSEVLRLIASIKFREFSENDRMSFQGCDSENPMIGENDDYLVILDGDVVCVLGSDPDSEQQLFFLRDC